MNPAGPVFLLCAIFLLVVAALAVRARSNRDAAAPQAIPTGTLEGAVALLRSLPGPLVEVSCKFAPGAEPDTSRLVLGQRRIPRDEQFEHLPFAAALPPGHDVRAWLDSCEGNAQRLEEYAIGWRGSKAAKAYLVFPERLDAFEVGKGACVYRHSAPSDALAALPFGAARSLVNTAFLGTAGAVLRWEGSGEGAPVRVHVKCHHRNKSGEACKEDLRAVLRALGCDDFGLDQRLKTWGHLPLVSSRSLPRGPPRR